MRTCLWSALKAQKVHKEGNGEAPVGGAEDSSGRKTGDSTAHVVSTEV